MSSTAYKCWECLDTGTYKTVDHLGNKVWVDCSQCDMAARRTDDQMQVTDEMVSRAMTAHANSALVRNPRSPEAAMRAALQAALSPPTVIPRDGREHACVCGHGRYVADNGDGWLRRWRVIDTDKVDVDCSGEVDECRECGRGLVPAASQGQEERG